MASRTETIDNVKSMATTYLKETGDENATLPTSLVDFVYDYAVELCHFPNHFTEDQIANVLSRNKYVLAMMCQEVYSRSEILGEKQHSENGVVRVYDRAWISDALVSALPNFVNTPSTLRI